MSSGPVQAVGNKRKAATTAATDRKRQKTHNIRDIPVQSKDAAVSATGELDVAAFVKAREYEINALEKSIEKSKKGLTMRAFQNVPRAMRRRTASHNVKKVPRRLRRRAEREMKEDNTPTVTARRRIPSPKQRLRLENAKRLKALHQHSKTVRQKKKQAQIDAVAGDAEPKAAVTRLPKIKKDKLADPPTATSKFKKRQVHKSWLPTHLWHTKRAHMSKPSEPLWRMAIPISPTEKSYRPSHRASSGRGCIAWDMSYMSTIGCQGNESSLDAMLKAIGFHGEGWAGPKYKKWKNGSRSAEGWVFERDNENQAVAPVVIIWDVHASATQRQEGNLEAGNVGLKDVDAAPAEVTGPRKPMKSPQHRLLLRLHPSAFHQFWLLLLKVAKMQRPQAIVEDLRFEIGSIEITGPGSTEALLGVLKPMQSDSASSSTPDNIWESLAGLSNPASLPANCLLALDMSDPRLRHPPKQIDIPYDPESDNALTELMVSWPPDQHSTPRGIFSHKCRYLAVRSLPSQKSINRRKTLAPPGQTATPKPTDPRIPVLLLATRPPAGSSGVQGTWTVLLPWKCVDAVWCSLMYYPLSSGGNPRFGGLDQKRQICFEHGRTWFPGDAAATAAGQAWERTESAKRFDEWTRRPASRRVAWEAVDLGNGRKGEHGRGWACDWNYLLTGQSSEPVETVEVDGAKEVTTTLKTPIESKAKTQRQRKLAKATQAQLRTIEPAKGPAKAAMPQLEKTSAEMSGSSASAAPRPTGTQTSQRRLQTTSDFLQLPPTLAIPLLKNCRKASMPAIPSLVTVRIRLLTRGTPASCARIYQLPSTTSPASDKLRKSWLALDPTPSPARQPHHRAVQPNTRIKQERLNHRGNPKHHTVLPLESLDHVNYIPADAPPEYFKTPEHLKQTAVQAAALAAAAEAEAQARLELEVRTTEERAALLESLMVPAKDTEGNAHPPCPDEGDLIGFVTSGAYNLAEGRGTAVGSVWVQKVIEGWRAGVRDGGGRQPEIEVDRQRRLCVVRNAGESVGRLALWEVCE